MNKTEHLWWDKGFDDYFARRRLTRRDFKSFRFWYCYLQGYQAAAVYRMKLQAGVKR